MNKDSIKTGASVIVTVGVVASSTFYASAAQAMYIGSTTDKLNLRAGASVKYKIILEIPKGKSVEVMSSPNSSGWVKVRYAGKEGWCNASYIKEKSTTVKYVSGVRRLSLLEKASTSSKSFGYVYEGEKVNVVDNTGDFARIKYSGKIYYILRKNLVSSNPAKTMYISGTRRKGLYETASTKSKRLMYVYEGEKVKVVGKSGNYLHITYDGKRGYLYNENVSSSNPAKTMYISGTRRKGLYETASTKSNRLMYVYEGEKVKVVGKKGNYLHVIYDNKRGYLYNENVSSSNPAKTMYISGVWRKGLYETASTKSNRLMYIYEAEKVEVVGKKGNYLHVIYDGKRGYLYNENVISSNPVSYGYIGRVESVPVMNGSDEISGYLSEGQKIKIFGKKDDKIRISFNGKTGFIKDENCIEDYQVKVVNGANSVDVYKDKNTSSSKLGSVKEDVKVDVYEVDGSWSKIKYSSGYGYVLSKYLKDIKVINKDISLRATKSDKGDVVYKAKKGGRVEVESYTDGWAKVKIDTKSGYVKNQYLSSVDFNNTQDDNSGYITTLSIEEPNVNKRYVLVDGAKVYKDPSVSNSIYGVLRKNSQLEYINSIEGYYKVKVNNNIIGYVKKSEIGHRDISAKNTSSIVTKKIAKSHDEYVDSQVGKPYVTIEDVRYYSNPSTYSLSNEEEKYQFLKLDNYNRINAYELNEYLNGLSVKSGNKAIFKNQAEAFINAAKKYNIDPVYLISHTMLETGYGSSKLAQGIVVDKDLAGNSITPVTVYNLYGIGAVDSDANGLGSKTAYALGWTSIPKAIEGAAKWISLGTEARPEIGLKKSDGYIHSSVFTDQYNLYSMRFDYVKGWHQYASDVCWQLKISRLMSKLSYMYEGADLVFEKMEYAQNIKSTIFGSSKVKDMMASSNVIVRSGPSANFRNIGSLSKNDIVKVIGEASSYWIIDFNGENGYVPKTNLSEVKVIIEPNDEVIEEVLVDESNNSEVNEFKEGENELDGSKVTMQEVEEVDSNECVDGSVLIEE